MSIRILDVDLLSFMVMVDSWIAILPNLRWHWVRLETQRVQILPMYGLWFQAPYLELFLEPSSFKYRDPTLWTGH